MVVETLGHNLSISNTMTHIIYIILWVFFQYVYRYLYIYIKDTGTTSLYIIIGPFAKLEYGDTLVKTSLNKLEELSFFQ